tara:strand:- start:1734 stop:2381 length:648 start_codon:yes stop_codon:yes gene_type:complete
MIKMSTSNRGVFISFEGIDGCGKSTQVQMLLSKLDQEEIKCKLVREPGGSNISEEIRNVLLKNRPESMDPRTEALLMTASRAQLTKEKIIPALESGTCIIADRYKDSTLAYQGGGRLIDIEYLIELNEFATYGLDPDLTIFIDISAEEAKSRSDVSHTDRIESIGLEFQEQVRKLYLALAKRFPDRFIKIDGNNSIEVIHSTIWEKTINCINAQI